ncbi:hypothetical protein ACFZAR_43045 [Streptomyces sp. NPDC008222]|uniref:hypothetical protein n=1 Tax=Streptomyces sp. NPDC008222 TaxID=3364820 RepID=UPI0036E1BA94
MSTEITKVPATGAAWFNLHRHDGEEGDTAPEGTADADNGADDDTEAERLLADAVGNDSGDEADDDTEDDSKPDSAGLGDAGKKALDRMKAERAAAKKAAAAEKKRADDLARKVQEFEDAKKSDLEKAQAQADRAKEKAEKAVARSVRSEIKVAASDKFADASDAIDVLMRDPQKYADADGEIDTDAIEADLADLLERKPHWGKPEPAPVSPAPESKPKPKPDPGQGSRGGPAKVDFRTASDEEYAAELAKYGVRKRY